MQSTHQPEEEEQQQRRPNRPPKKNPCPWPNCNKLFTCQHNVEQHIREAHTHERPYVCEMCLAVGRNSAFARPGSLYRHERRCHRFDREPKRGVPKGVKPPTQRRVRRDVAKEICARGCGVVVRGWEEQAFHDHVAHGVVEHPGCECGRCRAMFAGPMGWQQQETASRQGDEQSEMLYGQNGDVRSSWPNMLEASLLNTSTWSGQMRVDDMAVHRPALQTQSVDQNTLQQDMSFDQTQQPQSGTLEQYPQQQRNSGWSDQTDSYAGQEKPHQTPSATQIQEHQPFSDLIGISQQHFLGTDGTRYSGPVDSNVDDWFNNLPDWDPKETPFDVDNFGMNFAQY